MWFLSLQDISEYLPVAAVGGSPDRQSAFSFYAAAAAAAAV